MFFELSRYSIPLNTTLNLGRCRMVQELRVKMIETVLESSRSPFRKYIHCRCYFLLIFVNIRKRKISPTLNTLEMVEISISKNDLQKGFLKTQHGILWDLCLKVVVGS